MTPPECLNGDRCSPHLHSLVDAVVDEDVLTLCVGVCVCWCVCVCGGVGVCVGGCTECVMNA